MRRQRREYCMFWCNQSNIFHVVNDPYERTMGNKNRKFVIDREGYKVEI